VSTANDADKRIVSQSVSTANDADKRIVSQ
jgi:hypothetical protein